MAAASFFFLTWPSLVTMQSPGHTSTHRAYSTQQLELDADVYHPNMNPLPIRLNAARPGGFLKDMMLRRHECPSLVHACARCGGVVFVGGCGGGSAAVVLALLVFLGACGGVAVGGGMRQLQ